MQRPFPAQDGPTEPRGQAQQALLPPAQDPRAGGEIRRGPSAIPGRERHVRRLRTQGGLQGAGRQATPDQRGVGLGSGQG
eukprot:1080125-Heterocapsa_arctica.AAC.1